MTLRAPLVPADCDLRGLPWMPVDTVRLMDSDINAIASGEEFRAAVRLWCKAWHQVPAGSLPNDDRILATLSGYGPKWKRLRALALHGFVECSDGRLYHPVICEKALEAWKHRQAQRERAAKRWHGSGTAAAHATVSTTAHAEAMLGTGTGTGKRQDSKKEQVKTAAAAPPVDPAKNEIWKTGRGLLESEGMSRERAGSFLGKLCKDFGQVLVLQAVRDCVNATPAKASEWLMARCQERRALGASKQGQLEARNAAAMREFVEQPE